MNLAVIIPAAGASRRYSESAEFGAADRSKLDEDLGGRPLLHRTVELFTKLPEVSTIIVAGPADDAAYESFKLRHGDKLGLLGVSICRGGRDHRYETVANALKLIPDSTTHVAVHDAARPCASPELIDRVLRAAEAGHKAVVPGLDVPDTLKRVAEVPIAAAKGDPLAAIFGDEVAAKPLGRLVEQTVDRGRLVSVQTPQIFEVALLKRAYGQADLSSTDDAQLVERLGEPVLVVPGDPGNLKVTRYADMHLARAVLGVRGPAQRDTHKRF